MPAVGRGALTPPSEVRFKMRGELRRQGPGVGIDTAEKLRTGHATMDVEKWKGAPYQAIATSLGEAFCFFIFFCTFFIFSRSYL